MDDIIKTSVIVPIYNVEKYLNQCLDSIVNQTLNEIEIICVNDGSTDNSLQILKEYAKKDERIKIINKGNRDIGAARNTGLEHVNGEYVGFVDSDDWVDLDMYGKLYENAKIHQSDIVMCPIHLFDENDQRLKYDQPYFTLECFDRNFDNRAFTHRETKAFIFNICVTAWNKIYKTEYLRKFKIRFPENLIFEDTPFFFETFLKARHVSVLKEYLYFYRVNRADSIIKSAGNNFYDIIKINNLIKMIFIDTGNFDNYKIGLFDFIIGNSVSRLFEVAEHFKQEFYDLIKQDFKDMNLSATEINELTYYNMNSYKDIICSNNYREFELLEERYRLKSELRYYEEQLKAQRQLIQELTSSNSSKLTKPMRKIGSVFKRLEKKN